MIEMKFEVTTELMNGNIKSFITKEYDSYSPEKKLVNGLHQIGFVKDGKKRMTWTPYGAGANYDHNVRKIVITNAETGRRIDTIIALH